MPSESRADAAEKMAQLFLESVPLQKNDIIAGYWPIKGEMDVLPLLRTLAQRGHVCALPCVVGKKGDGRPLIFRVWREGTQMVEAAFGIRQPGPVSPIVTPDIMIVPMLAFDRARHRLGYGAGYYDRTLAQLKSARRILAAGVAYETQFLDDMPIAAHDIPLDMIVTDQSVYR